jgi:hypothetical protein
MEIWTKEEANKYFNGIENNQHREWYDLEFKEKLCWEDTTSKKNTTQRAISGFANTFGGKIIIGFKDNGNPLGWEKISDIENHIFIKLDKKLNLVPIFKTQEYHYKDKLILVIFIESSKEPIQCDDGVYYYREQSSFRFIPHQMLKEKFERVFSEEMYIDLVRRDLESLQMHLNTLASNTISYKVSTFTKHFIESAEKLYFYYKEKRKSEEYFKLLNLIRQWIAGQNMIQKNNYQISLLQGEITSFLKDL